MERIQKSHQAVYQGLGGSFDVYTGYVKRAPKWWVSNNMEWTYRLLSQPSRIKRQIHLVRFFIKFAFKPILIRILMNNDMNNKLRLLRVPAQIL